jgi:mannose-6-phosphate isomerase-like protein (cupin superfamily)
MECFMGKTKFVFVLSALFVIFCISAAAQSRQPSKPLKPFIVKTAQSVDELEKTLRVGNKTEDLIGGEGMQLRVAIQHDKVRETADAEVHDASDDIYYVLDGSAKLTLGGSLENPREGTTGEWKSKTIIGGTTFEIKKGDLIIVPRGTPHQRTSIKGQEFSMILIKVFAEAQKAK